MPEANIITGQYVQISQSPASLGERIVAQIIDDFLIICYLVGVSLLIAELDFFYRTKMLFFLIAIYLPALFYHFLMELFNHGQSVGKMVMRIRVVKKDGTTPALVTFLYVGFCNLSTLVSLGLVHLSFLSLRIHNVSATSQQEQWSSNSTIIARFKSHLTNSLTLTESINLSIHKLKTSLNQLDVIQRTLNSEYGYERDRRIASLAEKVRTHLNISDTNTADEKFLYTIIRDYQHFTLEII